MTNFLFKKTKYFVFCIFFIGSYSFASNVSIAVSEFNIISEKKDLEWLSNSFSEALTTNLSMSKQISVIERKFLNKTIEELKIQASGIVDENSAVELGNLLAARYFLIGSLTINDKKIIVTTRIIDISTSKVISSQKEEGNIENLSAIQNSLSNQILKGLNVNDVKFTVSKTVKYGSINSFVSIRLNRISKIIEALPLFQLDPARKRKLNDYSNAIIMCDDIIERYPEHYDAHYFKGILSIQIEDFSAAEEASLMLKALDANNIQTFLLRSFYFFTTKKYTEARGVLDLAVKQFPNDSRPWFSLFKLNEEKREVEKSIECLLNTVNLQPNIQVAEGKLKSIILTNNDLKPDSFSNSLYFDLTNLYKVYFSVDTSIDRNMYDLAKAITNKNNSWYLPYLVMGIYERANNDELSANNNLYQAIKAKSNCAQAHKELGELLITQGNCNSGKKHIQIYYLNENAILSDPKLTNLLNKCN